eukprot:CAMPEP_0194097826 /NCGR_PEP_ID=MMETSP0149-20130528/58064_1 /TAXON_ID=122233 /ORGANISM="Chaetoceros debilis, Strain MM31A-1" /LENGTH=182 /DNA_ID=CAMNT_0038783855 /DNA_START=135 /DNA_END=680 /DNA_ORIENTATION=+
MSRELNFGVNANFGRQDNADDSDDESEGDSDAESEDDNDDESDNVKQDNADDSDDESEDDSDAESEDENDDESDNAIDDVVINDQSLETRQRLTNKAVLFLHRLRKIRPTQDEVETVIDMFPLALSTKDDEGRLPVQNAAVVSLSTAKFIPLLAEKGSSLDIGGAGMRGGLLCTVPGVERNW